MDISASLQQQVMQAVKDRERLNICGGNSKAFLGRHIQGRRLDAGAHSGIIKYEPRELVVTARSGTQMVEIESTLAQSAQVLAFEPPHFGITATLGGTVACGLSGQRRPFAGSARDFTLGCRMLNGRGEILQFGGQVMKNVAGYDISRLMVGAFGTLGVLLDISLKVMPRAAASLTLMYECDSAAAIKKMRGFVTRSYPVDAACYFGERCYVRLSGSAQAVREARASLGGEEMQDSATFWHALNEHKLPFFTSAPSYYRVIVKPATPPLGIRGKWFLDWGGAQRWLVSDDPDEIVRRQVEHVGGHVTQISRENYGGMILSPLIAPLLELNKRLKHGFDPHGIFNIGRMYEEI